MPFGTDFYPTKQLAKRAEPALSQELQSSIATTPTIQIVESPETLIELQIQAHIEAGDAEYLAGHYAQALGHYLQAWNSIPTYAWSWFPDFGASVQVAERLLAQDSSVGVKASSATRLLGAVASTSGSPARPRLRWRGAGRCSSGRSTVFASWPRGRSISCDSNGVPAERARISRSCGARDVVCATQAAERSTPLAGASVGM